MALNQQTSNANAVTLQPTATAPLFRPEALDEARSRMGAPVRLLGVSGWAMTLFFVALLAMAAAFACTTHYAHKRAALTAYGRDWPLTPGMRLSADLILEERSLLEWLVDPLRAATHEGDGA